MITFFGRMHAVVWRTLILEIAIAACFFATTAFAAPSGFSMDVELTGYAWSSNVGWISMNCSNDGSCGSVDYKVVVKPDGTLSGYAWNSTGLDSNGNRTGVGWLKFGGLPTPPAATGNPHEQAQISGTFPNWQLSGFARFCGATQSGDCTGALHSEGGGWDGWVSLRGSSHGIQFTSTGAVAANSYAWASGVPLPASNPVGLGWIRFDSPTGNGVAIERVNPIISLTPSTPDASVGGSLTLTYTVDKAFSCTMNNSLGDADWSGPLTALPSGSTVVSPSASGAITYELTCDNGFGDTTTETVTITVKDNVVVGAFSMASPGSPTASGTYPVVNFQVNVTGVVTPVDYEFNTSVVPTKTGVISSSGNEIITLFDVPFGPLTANILVDYPFPGVIDEDLASTPANEDEVDNQRSLSVLASSLPPPPVSITIEPSVGDDVIPDPVTGTPSTGILGTNIVRYGDDVDMEITFNAPYIVSCTISGAGVSGPATVTTSGVFTVDFEYTFTTAPVTATFNYQIVCVYDDPAIPDFMGLEVNRNEYVIETVPQVEEI